MKYWFEKVAVVTDCNSHLGACIIEELAKAGMVSIGLARTSVILENAENALKRQKDFEGKVVLRLCDVTNWEQLKKTFEKIAEDFMGIDVLINNAHCIKDCNLSDGPLEDFREIIDVNIHTLIAGIRLAAGSIIERRTRGHIININDLYAYDLPKSSEKNVFIASKTAMTSVNEILRHEFRYLKANIKVTNVACGRMESAIENIKRPILKSKDIADVILSILNTPENLQVHEILLEPVVD